MYEAVRGRVPVLLHMGDERYNYSHPVKLRHVLDLFPGLDVIAAHFGGYGMYEEAYTQLKDKNCIFHPPFFKKFFYFFASFTMNFANKPNSN